MSVMSRVWRQALYQEALARNILTTKQLRALELWSRELGYQRIGHVLGISRDAARGRVLRAIQTVVRDENRKAA